MSPALWPPAHDTATSLTGVERVASATLSGGPPTANPIAMLFPLRTSLLGRMSNGSAAWTPWGTSVQDHDAQPKSIDIEKSAVLKLPIPEKVPFSGR